MLLTNQSTRLPEEGLPPPNQSVVVLGDKVNRTTLNQSKPPMFFENAYSNMKCACSNLECM